MPVSSWVWLIGTLSHFVWVGLSNVGRTMNNQIPRYNNQTIINHQWPNNQITLDAHFYRRPRAGIQNATFGYWDFQPEADQPLAEEFVCILYLGYWLFINYRTLTLRSPALLLSITYIIWLRTLIGNSQPELVLPALPLGPGKRGTTLLRGAPG